MMTSEELLKHLSDHLEDEISDSKGYLKMAKKADEIGKKEMAHYLLEIAKDEYTHARYIKKVMHEFELPISSDLMLKYNELESELNEYFR